jgi:CRP-like cAMP-binding protein
MLSALDTLQDAQQNSALKGQCVLRRGTSGNDVVYVDAGRVALGLLNGKVLEHQIGVLEGPCWLDITSVVLDVAPLVDAVAEGVVHMRCASRGAVLRVIADLPAPARAVLRDMALAHRQQTEFAVSRLAKDAEARCAEWLLSHAQPAGQGHMAVQLQQHKRSIAVQLGIAPETLSRVLRHLREQSLISGSGRVLNLLDLGGLRSLAGV